MDLMGLVPNWESDRDKRSPKIVHDCREPPDEDEVDNLIKGNDLFSRFSRWVARKRILSTNHYYAQACLKSSTAVKFEISRHLQDFPYMIHPFSPFRIFWDITMTIFTLAALIATPFLNAFFFNDQLRSLPFIMIIDFVMLFDVILHFFTGYFDYRTKIVTLDPRIVFTKYIRSYFIFDILSGVPAEVFDFMAHGDEHINWYCSTFNFVKIFRVRNLICCIRQFHKSYHMSFHKVKILELTIIIIISIHWSACLVYYVPMVVQKFDGFDDAVSKSWILSASMKKRNSRLKKYILCLNRATISLVSSEHYLDVTTAEDMIMNFLLAVLGKLGFVYLLSQFLQLMTTFHSSAKERLRLLQQLQEYVQYKELPRVTQKRLMVYCNYWYKKNFNRDRRIHAQVSEPLREELILHNYTSLLEMVDLFKYLPRAAIVELVKFIRTEIHLVNDVIVKSGTHGDCLFFVGSGTVAVYTSLGKEVCHLEDGSYFGEIALVMENEQRVASVVAVETCEILVVPREAFQQVVAPYPNLLSQLQKVALERLDKTLLLDEIYKLEDPRPRYINISNIRGKRRD
ncbi:potassium/sodium hyperpolarization-activated cyclic nucleotide-gated channel 4-like [Nasonia vitripennis]|uniref:Cyclic nucleotide-binding domain-containing protein n=1 Tax=Nasonia vitripennis TaxID=7425 RepID=A0A7M7HCH4_NASVI|nr:potassium/sodium hyperpolarization-activated cyclic nucleotide-gated channel 4-like [Nasonia vitripennis]XP_016845495.1 potassium/sodium hyperpolarization-activated cyclic nucleotide-gated channel 4-like [Nasonia vitripennis]